MNTVKEAAVSTVQAIRETAERVMATVTYKPLRHFLKFHRDDLVCPAIVDILLLTDSDAKEDQQIAHDKFWASFSKDFVGYLLPETTIGSDLGCGRDSGLVDLATAFEAYAEFKVCLITEAMELVDD